MSYKFYKSTTTRKYEVINGVEIAFELTSSNKNNVYTYTNIYTSSYKNPIGLGIIKKEGEEEDLGLGKGNNFNIVYKIDKSQKESEEKLVLTHPHKEEEEFIYYEEIDEYTKKYISRTSENYVLYSDVEITYNTKSIRVVFDNNGSSETQLYNNKYEVKGNVTYRMLLTYDNSKRLITVGNEAYEKEYL